MKVFFRSAVVLLFFLILLCGVYPAAVTLVGTLLFPLQAQGSLVERDGKVVGSVLIGQRFTKPYYFHGRPSAAGADGYDGASSSGSNLGSTSKKLFDRIQTDTNRLKLENPSLRGAAIPTELVTASASGLDPHISPRSALVQIDRVAAARQVGESEIRALVGRFTQGPQLGLLGDRTVNVLLLNLELDRLHPVKP